LLAAAARRSKREVEELIARRFPKPDVPASVRKVPVPTTSPSIPSRVETPAAPPDTPPSPLEAPPNTLDMLPMPLEPLPMPPAAFAQRAAVKPLAADRYEVRFTASAETRNKLKVAQDLLRHAVPGGDLAAIVDRALDALIERLSREKLAIVRRPKAASPPTRHGTRHVPSSVRRAVWARDRGRCAFASPTGHRCGERAFLEYHHLKPFAVGGEASVANIELRCRAHNGYEADLFFGGVPSRGRAGVVGERSAKYAVSWESSPVPERVRAVRGRSGAIPGGRAGE
jgi:hypothetical protein